MTNDKPLTNPQCRFNHERQWSVDHADTSDWTPDTRFGSHQSIQLLTDATGAVFMIGFHTNRGDAERADLFLVDLDQPVESTLSQVASRAVSLRNGTHFRFAAGLWIDEGRLRFLASERNLQAITRLSITGSESQEE